MDKKKCIMICDDDDDILEVSRLILVGKGYKVETTCTSHGLIQKAETLLPDVILMDLRIPTLGGEEMTKRLKANQATCHIPVIIFSANALAESIANECGADGVLPKPFSIVEMEKQIERQLLSAGNQSEVSF
ncbi:MAG: response regulator [Bacteroidota bacterium]